VQTPLSFADILHHPHFQATVEALAQKAHTALPLADGRIEKAVAIVLSGAGSPSTRRDTRWSRARAGRTRPTASTVRVAVRCVRSMISSS